MSFQILITCVGTSGILTRINRFMEDKLIPRNVYRRQQDQQKHRQSQQSDMDSKRVERDRRDLNQSVSASNDHYMVSALSKVRESNVTHHEDLTRINGTWMHNQNMKK